MSDHSKTAALVAAKKTGLRPDQIIAAVEEYRAALTGMEVEPEWRAILHASGAGLNVAQYGAEGTEVTLQIDSWTERGQWKSERTYCFKQQAYETFAEARAAESAMTAKFTPREVRETVVPATQEG